MATMRLPGLVDAHVHLREPGYEHKEDFYSGTVAALAGGVVTVLDMPNTAPPTSTPELLCDKARRAAAKAVCDVGLFVGATTSHLDAYLPAAQKACGLKIYVSDTFGSLRIESLALMHRFFRTWAERAAAVGFRPRGHAQGVGPVAVHAEELMLPVCLALSHLYDVPLHVVHVSRRSEIELIREAKARGYPVTCEATPHHLFLSADDAARLGPLGDMRPRLATPDDVAALWENMEVIDIVATDHAPHTLAEKGVGVSPEMGAGSHAPPPGVPGVETMLPLLLTAVHAGRLALDDVIEKCALAPRRIYGLPEPPETYIEVDVDARFTLRHAAMKTRVGWTPFDGREVYGQVQRVVLRGREVFAGGEVVVLPGTGRVLFDADQPS
ncbi:MAG TPA: amidohydrolase family protein [Caldilineaceae bacterium]|nr:amidohydrolase family protein [Caldilineaceae bacterium]